MPETAALTRPLPWTSPAFRLAIEAAPTAMVLIDQTGQIVLVNAHTAELFGYAREELVGMRVEELVPERSRARHPAFRSAYFEEPRARLMGAGRDLHALRKDGSEVPVEIGLNPIDTAEGRFVLSSIIDITERKRAERERESMLGELQRLNAELEGRVEVRTAELSTALRDREILLQEVHHRVKNNLQIISSLVNMQARKLEAGPSRDALRECQTRVQAIALIHERLYQSQDYSRVPLSEYVRSLAASVFNATGTALRGVELEFAIDDISLTVDKAIPCGLVLNELITNALKHAFRDGRSGTLLVELVRTEGELIRLAVRDDGVGLPADFQTHRSHSLGIQLVTTLAEQLDAALTISSDRGASFELVFAAS